MTEPTIELRGLTKAYAGTRVLADLELDMGPRIVGLLGPNGAGKTTLLRILATVLGPSSGTARILGRDPADRHDRVEIRRRLGYLPQELGYPRGFTARGFVDYMAVLKELDEPERRRAEVRRVLGAVGLGDLATKRIRTLSGGQRRRVGLAQALLGAPEVLVLDEPTTGLDPEQRVSLRGVLAEVGREATVILATHQTEDVAALCDHVVVLDGGAVRHDGTVADLVDLARGRVWLADAPDPQARASWRTASGRYRNVGHADPLRPGLVEPTLEDAYLVLRGASAPDEEVAS